MPINMNNISKNDDFCEAPRTKHVKKRLIKSRVLSKLLLSLSRGEICQSDIPFTREHIDFIKSLSSIQITEFSNMLISDFSIDLNVEHHLNNEFKTGDSLGKLIAKHYIDEWILSCSNDFRIVYDEHSKGLPNEVLNKLINASPFDLKEYENTLVSSGYISFEYDINSFAQTTLNAQHLFKQDKLILCAVKSGASLPQIKQFFSNHRLCDSRSIAVIKKLHNIKGTNGHVSCDINELINTEFIEMKKRISKEIRTEELFLSELYNLLTSFVERFNVSFSDSWNVIRSSSEKNTIRSHK
jgi:hypothetical protein